MKKYVFILLACASLFSCNNEVDEVSPAGNGPQDNVAPIAKIDAGKAQQEFAKILSKAVFNNTEVRQFLKNEAIKQFDNDYDVFYPYVKDKVVAESKTFRDILLSYCDDEKTLLEIEETLPLLNILVPDLSYVGDFRAENWDTSDNEVAVSYLTDKNEVELFADGENLDILEPGEIPGFPVLVVKNNERLKITASTKAAGTSLYSYDFISDAFNGQLRPQTKSDTDIPLNPEVADNFLPASEVDQSIVQAYIESKSNPSALDRDYVYYGLSKANPHNGVLNANVRETLYKFKIDFSKYGLIADQNTEDPHLQDVVNKKGPLTNAEVLARIWTKGKFEIYFDAYMCIGKFGAIQCNSIPFSVEARELFDIAKIHLWRKHSTAFRHSKYTYSVDPKNLISKWVVTKNKVGGKYVFTAPWDLANNSLNIIMAIYERDASITTTHSSTITSEFAGNANFSSTHTDGGHVNKIDVGIGSKTSQSETITTVREEKNDDLGRITASFCDPIILSERTKNGVKGYNIFTLNNGAVEIMMLPVKLR